MTEYFYLHDILWRRPYEVQLKPWSTPGLDPAPSSADQSIDTETHIWRDHRPDCAYVLHVPYGTWLEKNVLG